MNNPPPSAARIVYGLLWRYVTPHKLVGLVAVLSMAASAAVEASLAKLLEPLIDRTLVALDLGSELLDHVDLTAASLARGQVLAKRLGLLHLPIRHQTAAAQLTLSVFSLLGEFKARGLQLELSHHQLLFRSQRRQAHRRQEYPQGHRGTRQAGQRRRHVRALTVTLILALMSGALAGGCGFRLRSDYVLPADMRHSMTITVISSAVPGAPPSLGTNSKCSSVVPNSVGENEYVTYRE